jgi:hypothetical protein
LSRILTEELFIFDTNKDFPLNLWLIAYQQTEDENLQTMLHKKPGKYSDTVREGIKIYEHNKTTAIYVPAALHASILQLYHTTLQHPGIKCMSATVREDFYWPGMDAAVEALVCTCATCQKCKLTAVKNMGRSLCQPTQKQPLGNSPSRPFWSMGRLLQHLVCSREKHHRKNHALTIIDKTMGWSEFTAINNMSSNHIALLFDRKWLCCYPRPARGITSSYYS